MKNPEINNNNDNQNSNSKNGKFSISKLRITPKLIVTYIVVAILPLIIIGIYSETYTTDYAREAGQQAMLQKTKTIAADIETAVNNLAKEVNFLANAPSVHGIIRASNNHNLDTLTGNNLRHWQSQLNQLFYSISLNKGNYKTICYANEKGFAVSQVDFTNGQSEIIKPQHLRAVKAQTVFREANKLPEGSIYISPLQVGDAKKGKVSVVECGVPVFNEYTQEREGVVFIKLIFDNILNKIESNISADERFYLVSSKKTFLFKSAKSDTKLRFEEIMENDNGFYIDDSDEQAFAYSTALVDKQNNIVWKVIYQANSHNLFSKVSRFFIYLIVWSILILAISIFTGYAFSRNLVRSLHKIRDALLVLGKGEHPNELKVSSEDELGEMTVALNKLVDGLKKTSDFAQEIGKGNLQARFNLLSKKDILGNSLLEMRSSLQKADEEERMRKEEEEKRNWITSGLAKFNDIIRQNSENVEELSYSIIKTLVQYLEANQGALFIINDEDKQEIFLEMKAVFAFGRRKYLSKKVEPGEGLVGRCAVEKETIYLTELPDDYFEISSGLGSADPKSVLIVPLNLNEEIFGIIEIASLKELEKHEIEFVEKIAETVASSISNLKISLRTSELLRETKIQADKLASKEEQMRRNVEELRKTQEEAAQKEAEASGFVSSVNHTIIRADYNLDGTISYANTKFLDTMGYRFNEVEGRHVSMFIDEKEEEDFKKQWERVRKGGKHIEQEMRQRTKEGSKWILATYTPIKDIDGNVIKILYLAIDIDRQKSINLDFQNQLNAIDLSIIKSEYTPEGKLISANDMFVSTLGYKKEEVMDKDVFFFVKDDEKEKFEVLWQKILRGMPFEGRLCRITKRGKERWFRGTYTAVRDFNGNVYKIMYIAYDINRQMRMEIAAKEQADKLKLKEDELKKSINEMETVQKRMTEKEAEMEGQLSAVNKANALIEFDLEGKIINVNDIFCEIFGYVASDVVDRNHRILLSRVYRDSDEYKQFWKKLIEGKARTGEFVRIHRDGSDIHLKGVYNPIFDAEGKPYKILSLCIDITRDKLREAQMSGQLEAIDRTNIMVEFALDGTITKANESFCDLFGYKKEDILGRHHRFIVPDDVKNSPEYNEFWINLRNGHPQQGEFKRVKKDGSEVFLKATLYPMLDSSGRPHKIMKLAFDITQIKQHEEQLRFKTEELASSEEELRQNLEELQATQEEMARKQTEMEKVNNKMKTNQRIMKGVMSRMKEQEDVLKKQRDELSSAQAEMEALIKTIDPLACISELDTKAEFTSTNDTFQTFIQTDKQQIIGKFYRQIMKCPKNEFDTFWNEIISGKVVRRLSKIKVKKEELWLQETFTPILNKEGKIAKVIHIGFDITETKQSEQQLKKQTQELQKTQDELNQYLDELTTNQEQMQRRQSDMEGLISAVDDALIEGEFNPKGEILRVNQNYVEVSGVKEKELLGTNVRRFIKKENLDNYNKMWEELLRGKPYTGLTHRVLKGKDTWLQATYTPAIDVDGKVYKIYYLGQNVTEAVELQQQADEQTKRFKEKEEQLKQKIDNLQKKIEKLRNDNK